jgi:hypothetical protein
MGAVNLSVFSRHPDRVVVSKIDVDPDDGVFFLDFGRPLEVRRWFGLGPAMKLVVPVIHQSETTSSFAIEVDRSDPAFPDIRSLWKKRYPSTALAVAYASDPSTALAGFRLNFPEDRSPPPSQ